MVRPGQFRGDRAGVRHPRAAPGRLRLDDAGQLDLGLDRAVQVEVPEEAVVVVADVGDEGDHHPAGPAHLGRAVVGVDVLPEDPVVLLVQADGALEDVGGAVLLGGDRVQVDDLAQAVAAEVERGGGLAEADVAGVERVLPPVAGRRRAVGHDHLGHAGPVQHGPGAAAFDVADLVQHEALDRVHRHPQLPGPPAELPVVDGEAGPVRLQDLQRRQRAPRADAGRVVPARVGGDGHHVAIDQLDDLAGVAVQDGDQVLHRPGVGVAARAVQHVGDAAGEPAPGAVHLQAEVAGRPRVDLDPRQVGDAAPRQGRAEARVGLDLVRVTGPLLGHDRRLHAGHRDAAGHHAGVQGRRHQPGHPGRPVVQHAPRQPGHGAAVPAQHRLPGRLLQRAVHQAGAGAGVQREPGRGGRLGDGERRQRMAGLHRVPSSSLAGGSSAGSRPVRGEKVAPSSSRRPPPFRPSSCQARAMPTPNRT